MQAPVRLLLHTTAVFDNHTAPAGHVPEEAPDRYADYATCLLVLLCIAGILCLMYLVHMQDDSTTTPSRGLFGVFHNKKRCCAREHELLLLHFLTASTHGRHPHHSQSSC